MLYRRVELPSDEPVQFVGVYVTRWDRYEVAPTVAFVEASQGEVRAELRRLAESEESATWKPIYWQEASGEYARIGLINRLTGDISPSWGTCLQEESEGMVR